jgi:hypothetical protein
MKFLPLNSTANYRMSSILGPTVLFKWPFRDVTCNMDTWYQRENREMKYFEFQRVRIFICCSGRRFYHAKPVCSDWRTALRHCSLAALNVLQFWSGILTWEMKRHAFWGVACRLENIYRRFERPRCHPIQSKLQDECCGNRKYLRL